MDKRYEEALERAKMILCNLPEGSSSARDIETIFPELQESEDEKTRMELIEFHKDAIHTLELQERKENEWEIEKHKEFIAYLEKQKEQQPVPALDRGDEIILKAICEELKDAPGWVERIEGWYRLAKDAQQPAGWSEGDERIRKNICRIVKEHMRHCAEAGIEIGDHREAIQYLEKQKGPRYTKEEVLEELRRDLCNNDIYRVPEWLREVLLMAKENGKKEQPHWKPSEAQKNALKEVLDMAEAYGILQKMGRTYDDIIELQNDLEEEF